MLLHSRLNPSCCFSDEVLLCYLWEKCRNLVFSIVASGHCIILISFMKLWLGTLQRLQACFFLSLHDKRDVLISWGLKVMLNLLIWISGKKKKVVLNSSLMLFFPHVVCSTQSHSEGQAKPHSLKLVSQHLKILERVCSLLWNRKFTVLCQLNSCYKSFYKCTHSRSNVQACFPDALFRSETCQYTSWFKWLSVRAEVC